MPIHEMPPMTLALANWSYFYTIVGSSAGALTGLMFVTIALRRDMPTGNVARAMRAFATPTVVHFTAVLVLSALQSMPGLSRASIGVALLGISSVLLLYVLSIIRKARDLDLYEPDLEDRIWHFFLPLLAYIGIAVGGAVSWSSPNGSRYTVGTAMLLLLTIGIHNAWDSAVWTIVSQADPK